jgi:peroxiredoxin
MVLAIGDRAPDVDGVAIRGSHTLVFYKTSCSVTRMATPPLARLAEAYRGAVIGVGQDPPEELASFATSVGWMFPQVSDLPPYPASDAYGITSAPTVVVVDGDGVVADVVESWDRDGLNRASATLAGLLGRDPAVVSTPDDGLPDFKPG